MAKRFIKPKPSTPSSSRGFTLIEMMVAMAITMIVLAAAWSVTMQVRKLYLIDEARTTLNQNLRGGMEVMAADVRQAGERLPSDPLTPANIPALQIIDGASGASDVVIMNRNMLDAVLPVCASINSGSATDNVKVADVSHNPPTGCAPVADLNGDGWPDNMEEWRQYRLDNGGAVRIYIYDPVTGLGEFVTYDAEDASTFKLHKTSGAWQNAYPQNNSPQVYALQQRKYSLNGNRLRLVIDDTLTYDISTDMTDLQAQAILKDGTVYNAYNGQNWVNIESIKVTLNGQTTTNTASYSGSLSMNLFPRNILSR